MPSFLRANARVPLLAAAVAALLLASARPQARQNPQPVHILIDQPLRAVEYQLDRLTIDELSRVDRKPDDARYHPVYVALLTRKGMTQAVRDEALGVLARMDRTNPTQVLIDALPHVAADDASTADKLVGMLLAQPADTLRAQHDLLARAVESATHPLALRAAYGGMLIADNGVDAAVRLAGAHDGHMAALLRSVPQIPADRRAGDLGAHLYDITTALLSGTRPADPGPRVAALAALGYLRPDAATFHLLVQQLAGGAAADPAARSAVIASLLLIPENAWPAEDVEPLARGIVSVVRALDPAQRTSPAALQAMELGEKLAAALPDPAKVSVRRDLRALGVRVVRLGTRPEQMLFDLNWFAVEAGKRVQIALTNSDAMPHNVVIVRPGTLAEVGNAAAGLPMPTDPDVKPFIPDLPAVLFSTKLVNEGDTALLNFTAPTQPGEYVFLCTFPGHWVRMYGVMLVVDNLEAWEAHPTTPLDPITKQPYDKQRK